MNPNPRPRMPTEDMEGYRDMLKDLLELDSGLSPWEVDFIESLNAWTGDFFEKQAKTLEKIYERRT